MHIFVYTSILHLFMHVYCIRLRLIIVIDIVVYIYCDNLISIIIFTRSLITIIMISSLLTMLVFFPSIYNHNFWAFCHYHLPPPHCLAIVTGIVIILIIYPHVISSSSSSHYPSNSNEILALRGLCELQSFVARMHTRKIR